MPPNDSQESLNQHERTWQQLPKLLRNVELSSSTFTEGSLDAVYIPTRGRREEIRSLTADLIGLIPAIYVIPSNPTDVALLPQPLPANLSILTAIDADLTAAYLSLTTSRHPRSICSARNWDLPLKRNFALRHARKRGYRRILFLDDDISGLSETMLRTLGAATRDSYAVGPLVTEYPDLSVCGHARRYLGEVEPVFVSGSCLALNLDYSDGFFPCIYNEDWIFLLAAVRNRSVATSGWATQAAYDPFQRPSRAVFEEFGDLISETLYSLILTSSYEARFDQPLWEEALALRGELLREIIRDPHLPSAARSALAAAEAYRRTFSATECIAFVEGLETDTVTFSALLN